MKTERLRPSASTRLMTLLGLLVACASPESMNPCLDDKAVQVSGGFTEGKGSLPGSPPPSTFPFRTSAVVESDYYIERVTIGGTPAAFNASEGEWEAMQYPADLERNRDGSVARLSIRATDLCGREHVLEDQAIVPLGPAPGLSVQDLAIQVELVPSMECSLPVSGRVQPLVRVTASAASAGAAVKLTANQGTFSSETATQELTLVASGDRAERTTFYSPEKVGYAVITASASGVTAIPRVIPVVGPPEFIDPTTTLERGVTHTVTVRSSGNLATCVVDAQVSGAATVTFLEPALGTYNGGIVDVSRTPVACDAPEYVRVQLAFAADAPDGSAVTLSCTDSFAQENHVTFRVAQTDPAAIGRN